jgi:hypothetical protein
MRDWLLELVLTPRADVRSVSVMATVGWMELRVAARRSWSSKPHSPNTEIAAAQKRRGYALVAEARLDFVIQNVPNNGRMSDPKATTADRPRIA